MYLRKKILPRRIIDSLDGSKEGSGLRGSARQACIECDAEYDACKQTKGSSLEACARDREVCHLKCSEQDSLLPPAPEPFPGVTQGGDEGDTTSDSKQSPPENIFAGGPIDCGTPTTINADTSYVIVTRSMFLDVLRPFIEAKQLAGERVAVALVERLNCTESGQDIPERIRAYLARVRAASRARNVLLVGSPRPAIDRYGATAPSYESLTLQEPWEVPTRYYVPLKHGNPPQWLISTDQYYASLTSSWDTRSSDWAMDFSFDTDFMVGRVPARRIEDVRNWVQKTLSWRTPNVFKESTFSTLRCVNHEINGDMTWSSQTTRQIIQHPCNDGRNGGEIPDFVNQELPDLVSSYSHGWVGGITRWPSPFGFTMTTTSAGFVKAPILFIHGCEVGGLDFTEESLAEAYMRRSDGVVAFVGSSRAHWDAVFRFQESIFESGRLTLGEAFYGAKRDYVRSNHATQRTIDNLFMYTLYGDPALEIVRPGLVITNQRSSFARVPGRVLGETYQTSVNIRSFLTSPIRGRLKSSVDGSFGPYAFISPGETVQSVVYGRTTDWYSDPQAPPWVALAHHVVPQFVVQGRTGCDTGRMTCISASHTQSLPVPVACGRLTRDSRGIKTAEVKVVEGASGSYTAELRMVPGQYLERGLTLYSQPATTLAYRYLENPAAQSVHRFTFGATPASIPYSQDENERGEAYREPTFFVEIRDERSVLVGACYYSGLDDDIEGVFQRS